ncbi:hypothetical protein [Sulfuriferula nivalis]|uniref:Uncharacterized protein n=1 Tax=Sulfuriferula nivalis TaxID=2675298 RepID=A0A809RU70_9PROT|nr:hypothetical protein [Sulfuriferula nivalis]BBP02461.1 hypothetical protein SFSGTM_31690 [Sulfuriferula nivalis]
MEKKSKKSLFIMLFFSSLIILTEASANEVDANLIDDSKHSIITLHFYSTNPPTLHPKNLKINLIYEPIKVIPIINSHNDCTPNGAHDGGPVGPFVSGEICTRYGDLKTEFVSDKDLKWNGSELTIRVKNKLLGIFSSYYLSTIVMKSNEINGSFRFGRPELLETGKSTVTFATASYPNIEDNYLGAHPCLTAVFAKIHSKAIAFDHFYQGSDVDFSSLILGKRGCSDFGCQFTDKFYWVWNLLNDYEEILSDRDELPHSIENKIVMKTLVAPVFFQSKFHFNRCNATYYQYPSRFLLIEVVCENSHPDADFGFDPNNELEPNADTLISSFSYSTDQSAKVYYYYQDGELFATRRLFENDKTDESSQETMGWVNGVLVYWEKEKGSTDETWREKDEVPAPIVMDFKQALIEAEKYKSLLNNDYNSNWVSLNKRH